MARLSTVEMKSAGRRLPMKSMLVVVLENLHGGS